MTTVTDGLGVGSSPGSLISGGLMAVGDEEAGTGGGTLLITRGFGLGSSPGSLILHGLLAPDDAAPGTGDPDPWRFTIHASGPSPDHFTFDDEGD